MVISGVRRADAHAGAVRAAAASTSTARPRPLLHRRSTPGSTRVTGRYARRRELDAPARRARAAAVRRHGASIAAGLCRAMPAGFVPDEDQGYLHRSVILPDGASLRAHRRGARRRSSRDPAAQSRSSRTWSAFTGFDFARRRLPQQRGDHLRHAQALGRAHRARPARSWSAQLYVHDRRTSRTALVLAFNAAGDLRPRHRRRLRVLRCRTAASGGRRELARGRAGSCIGAAQQRPGARPRARRFSAPTCRSSTSTSTARRPRRSACRSTTCSTRCRRTLGGYYVNDFNKLRPHLAGADAGRAGVPQRRRATSRDVYVRIGERRDGAARQRWRTVEYTRARSALERFNNLSARPSSSAAPRPGVSSGQAIARDRAGRRARCCRRASASTGPAQSYQEKRGRRHLDARARPGGRRWCS
ncbi:MAG: hypothetical protein MZW92_78520 [Comamonadaceae bacterium]|nr:hypothetical protein [Comamonadaceae bacterium]